MTERFLLLAILAVVGLVGALAIAVADRFAWRDLLRDGGIALILASVVALAFERYLRERLYQEIRTRMFDIMDRFRAEAIDASHLQRLPADIVDVVRETIVEAPVVLRDRNLLYEMCKTTVDGDSILRIIITTSVVYQNVTQRWVDTEISEDGMETLRHQRVLPPADAGFTGVQMEGVEGKHEVPFNLEATTILTFITNRERQQVFRRPLSLGPMARVKVTVSEIAYANLDDLDSYAAEKMTVGLTLIIDYPEQDLRFRVLPDEPIRSRLRADHITEERQRWIVSGALLPGQGLEYAWEPKAG